MTKLELIERCLNCANDYFVNHPKEIHDAILGGVNESDDVSTAAWKMAVAAAKYSCQISAATTATILLDLGLIECDD